MFTKILVATDRITVCDAPVVVAARLAQEFGTALSILHVSESSAAIDREFVKDYRTGETILYSEDYGRTIREALAQTCATAMGSGMDYGIDVMPGFPWMMILKTARKQRADLVVMGPHSGRAARVLSGWYPVPWDSTKASSTR